MKKLPFITWFLWGVGSWVIIALLVSKCALPPDPDAVQEAAQRATNAAVVVERTDTAIARAEQHIARTVPKRAHVAAQRQQLEAMHRHDAPPEAIVAVQESIIADQDSIIAQQDSALAELLPAAQTARDTLATYTTPIIPATPRRATLLGTVSKYVGPSLGYGAVLAGGEVQTGPTVLVGVHVTRGAIGLTAGYGVTQAGGKLHTGLGANLGVRVSL